MIEPLKEENTRLKDELATTQRELAPLRSSAETIHKLQSTLNQYQGKMEELINERLASKEMEMRKDSEARVQQFKDHETLQERQIELLQTQVKSLQSNHQVAQDKLVTDSMKYGHEVFARSNVVEMLTLELENANQRIGELEREDLTMKLRLQNGTGVDTENREVMLLEQKCQAQEEDIQRLVKDAEGLRVSLKEKSESYEKTLSDLQREIRIRQDEISDAKKQVSSRLDYDLIKKELDMVKAVEFGDLGDEAAHGSLEEMLMKKSRRLQTEFTDIKVKILE